MLCEMSSKGNLCSPKYQSKAIDMATEHKDYVSRFITMKSVAEGFLMLTPGVQIACKGIHWDKCIGS
jgi:Orotidine 5'-phosphate decarboxylase / HUMPS family